jgi:hypothetical protein
MPGGGYTLAVPLPAFAYVEFGLAGVIVCFAALGAFLAWFDRRFRYPDRRTLPAALAGVALITQLPILVRGGLPDGLVFLLLDVVGFWLVAWVCTTDER